MFQQTPDCGDGSFPWDEAAWNVSLIIFWVALFWFGDHPGSYSGRIWSFFSKSCFDNRINYYMIYKCYNKLYVTKNK